MGYIIAIAIAFIIIAVLYWFCDNEFVMDMDLFPVVLFVIGALVLFGCGMFSLGKRAMKKSTEPVVIIEKQVEVEKPKNSEEYFR